MARWAAIPRLPPLAAAPALGWAVTTVLALPVLSATGFTAITITLYAAAFLAVCMWGIRHAPRPGACLPLWAICLALAMGCLPLMAIMPKGAAGGILLAPPMFDHVKIALVDAILRDGLPVPNPFYGPDDPGHLAYYYLWHFGAAQLACLLHIGGWQAEAASTGFTAFAAMMLMMGLAAALGGRGAAVCGAALLALPGALRPVLAWGLGAAGANAVFPGGADIGNWLNQAAWVPQHMASAICVVLSALLMLRLAAGGWMVPGLLGATVAAGFESSVWVGGIAFAGAGTALGLWLLRSASPRARLLSRGLLACCLTALLIAPFVVAEWRGLAARHSGAGIMFAPYAVFGSLVPVDWRTALDLPGYWLIFLPCAFPALIPLGAVAVLRPGVLYHAPARLAATLAITALACLAVAWLLRSTLDNNDLGWRAVLPALLILSPVTAVLAERLARPRPGTIAACALLAALGLPQTAIFLRDYALGQRPGDPAGVARAAPLWRAVRGIAGPDDRVANNPLAVQAATPWPDNIGWALLADRPSCYAGWESVLAYGGLSRSALDVINDRFTRIFAGTPQPADLHSLATGDNCRIAVLTPADGAWRHDPFAASPLFRLAAQTASWRIYRRADLSQTAPGDAAAAFAPASASSYPPTRHDPPFPPAPADPVRSR
jgi:hypothetical protein